MLKNIQLMLDAAGILMNNYQIISSRTHTTQPIINENNKSNTSSSLNAEASTSAQANSSSVSNIKDPTIEKSADDKTKTSSAVSNTSISADVNKQNQVTIEDLGGEEHDYNKSTGNLPSTSSNSTLITPVSDTTDGSSSDLIEVRKRRLKFLEEKNKSTTSSD